MADNKTEAGTVKAGKPAPSDDLTKVQKAAEAEAEAAEAAEVEATTSPEDDAQPYPSQAQADAFKEAAASGAAPYLTREAKG